MSILELSKISKLTTNRNGFPFCIASHFLYTWAITTEWLKKSRITTLPLRADKPSSRSHHPFDLQSEPPPSIRHLTVDRTDLAQNYRSTSFIPTKSNDARCCPRKRRLPTHLQTPPRSNPRCRRRSP